MSKNSSRKIISVFFSSLFLPCTLLTAKALVNDSTDSYDPEAKCPHNEIMYNVKLMGGLKAGKFTDIGKVKSIKTCIRYVRRSIDHILYINQ